MSDTGESIFIEFDGNPEQLANELARVLERALGKAIADIQKDFTKIFSSSQATSGLKKVSKETQTIGKGWRIITDEVNRANASALKFAKTMKGIRTPEQQFKEFVRLTDRAEDELDQLKQAEDRIAKNPALGVHFRAIQQGAERLAREAGLEFRTLSEREQTAFRKMAEQRRVTDQGATTRARAEASERIVIAQQEGAKIVAETRAAGARRVAIIQAVTGQIRALERGLAAVFRTSASLFGSLARGAASSVSRLASIFRRGDARLDDSLDNAMTRRASILRGGMARQEAILASSVTRQSLQIQRLETRLSTGVLGAATGRSALGGLLGGGLAIGGGFAFVSLLRNLATAGADFTQGLAVLDAQLGLTDKQLANVRQTALDLGNDISLPGVSALDAAQAIQILTKQFGALGKGAVPAANAAAKGTLQLARAAETSAENAGRVIGSAVNVFGISADKAVQVADQITGALTVAAGVGFDQFAQSFQQGASVFAAFQVPALGAEEALTQFNTALAVLARQGLVGSDVGTSLKQFFLSMVRNTAPAKKALNEIADAAGVAGSVFFDESGNARALSDSLQIMRDGLKGATEQQRLQALQVIFGSDAVRVANALLKTNAEEYDKIRQKIVQQGLAAKIAAAQNQGLRGALDALNSVIETQGILVYEKLNKVLGNVVLNFADLANKLFSAGGAFAVARRALLGIAAGLGALLAFKTGVEVVRLLGVALSGLLTPFGLIAVAFAGIGAAISILLDRSRAFREAFDRLRETFGNLARAGIDFLQEKLGQLADFVLRTVIPPISRFITFIAENALSGLQSFAQMIARNVIPPLANFVNFIAAEVVPVVSGFFVDAFNSARDAVVGFWNKVSPVLQPAINGLKDFAGAMVDLFKIEPSGVIITLGSVLAGALGGFALGGPAGAAIGGLGAGVAALFATGLADNLRSALSGLGSSIIETLKVPFQAALDFVTGFFSADRLEGMARGFLDVVERIGFAIGNIVSDPRFLGAIAGIAAAAAVIAFRFVQGFARGIIDNVPALASAIGKGLQLAFEQALRGLGNVISDPQVLITALGAIFIGAQALSFFRRAGSTAGGSFIQGLRSVSFGGAFAGGGGFLRGGSGGAFITGLFGGDPTASVISNMKRAQAALVRELAGMRAVLRASGRTDIGIGTNVRAEFDRLSQAVGPSGIAGLRLRAAVTATFASLKAGSLQPLRDLGFTTGQIFAGLGRGAATAFAGAFAGIQIGQSLQGAGGLQQILGIGGLALALGTVNPLLGVTAGLAGALTIAFGDSATASEEMADQINAVASALRGAESPMNQLTETLFTKVSEQAPEVQTALGDLGFTVGDLIGKIKELGTDAPQGAAGIQTFVDLLKGNGPVLDQMVSAFEAGSISLDKLIQSAGNNVNIQKLGLNAEDLRAVLEFLTDAGVAASEGLELAGIQTKILGEEVSTTGQQAKDTRTLWEKLWVPPPDHLTPKIDETNRKLIDGEKLADQAREAIDRLFGNVLPPAFDQAMDDLLISLKDFPAQLQGINVATVIGQAEVRSAADAKAQEFLNALNQGIIDGEITAVPQVVASREQFLGQLTRVLNRGGLTGAEAQVLLRVTATVNEATTKREFRRALENARKGDLLLQVPVKLRPTVRKLSADEIEELINGGFNPLGQGNPGPAGSARGLVGFAGAEREIPVPITIKPVITVAQTAGDLANTGRDLAAALAVGVAVGAPLVAAALNNALTSAFSSGARAAAGVQQVGVTLSVALARGIASQAGAVSAVAGAVAQGAAQGAQAQAGRMVGAGAALGNSMAVGVIATAGAAYSAGAILAGSASAGASGGSLYSAGLNLSFSLASGIRAGASAVISAAIAVANAGISAARATLGIRSPSRVFHDIGLEIGRGLAAGLKDSETTISSAVDEAVSNAIEAARERLGRGRIAKASAASRLFEELQPRTIPGGPTSSDVSKSVDQVFDQIGVLVGIQQDVRNQNEDIKDRNADIRDNIKDMKVQLSKDLQAIRETRVDRIVDAFARRQAAVDIGRQRIEFKGLRDALRRALNESSGFDVTINRGQDNERTERRFDRTLNRSSQRGQANIGVILDFGQRIRDFAASLLESGASARRVTNEVGRYRNALIRQATAMGFNRSQVLNLVKTLGLSEKQLRSFVNASQRIGESVRNQVQRARANARDAIAEARDELERRARISTSLGRGTEAGRTNRSIITDALESIREFGQAAFEAGTPVATVVARMKEMRNQLVQQAVSMGFNREQIQQLVELMGLSNTQLAEFIRHLEELNEEIENPSTPPQPGLTIGPGGRLPEGFRELHVHLPFGDPEAVARAVDNRLAFELATAS